MANEVKIGSRMACADFGIMGLSVTVLENRVCKVRKYFLIECWYYASDFGPPWELFDGYIRYFGWRTFPRF